MSRDRRPKGKLNRRFNEKLFDSGAKAAERKPYPPGQHGPRLRRKVTDYSIGLIEKQKLRFLYGLSEKQFRRLFEEAKNRPGVTGEVFLEFLEMRLDNVVYTLGFARSRSASRQFVNHGHILVNGHKVDIPSYRCKSGDVVEIRGKNSSKQLATRALDGIEFRTPPLWLTVEPEKLRGTINRNPNVDELEDRINVQLIVEFYSR